MVDKPIYTGWKRDPIDTRDHLFLAAPMALPSSVDLSPLCSPVENQQSLGSCTGNAIAGALEYLEIKKKARFLDLSRLFVYYNERVIEGTISEDAGAIIRDGIKTLVTNGVCSEKAWPYNIKNFTKKPTAVAYKQALKRKIASYESVTQTETSIKTALASGYPIIFGFNVFADIESAEVARTGNLPMPAGKSIGGHAVLIVGYDDATSRFLVRNSWGANWGKNGYMTMPYAYVTDNQYADDFWIVRQ